MRKFEKLGRLLSAARLAAGIAQQADLAVRLGVTQQSVSRWESGTSRPRQGELAKIAAALGVGLNDLSDAAGYSTALAKQPSLDAPWPLQALGHEAFERFCADVLRLLHPGDVVHPYGGTGHKQEGLDIDVAHQDGKRTTYQCKRRNEFGPQAIAKAVQEHDAPSDRSVFLISKLATPKAREAIKNHPGWDLWDREDITREIRLRLSDVERFRLVDTYFPGQHRALLGELGPSVWRTPGEFFAATMAPTSGFTHDWPLLGREEELQSLAQFAQSSPPFVHLLTGAGGSGKSRVLKELADTVVANGDTTRVYFAAREAMTSKDLHALGPGKKLLICDDAHERSDIALLIDFAADPKNQSLVILAQRAYGFHRVEQQVQAICGDHISKTHLAPLSLEQSKKLADQALERYGADRRHADALARYTRDCPLATILGARVLADTRDSPWWLLSEEKFRHELMRLLVSKTVSGVSQGLNESSVRITLGALALLQPLVPDDPALAEALGKIAGLSAVEVKGVLKRLREAGVVFRHGTKMRIAPDLLGDFLVEDQCIDANGSSTGFAEQLFDAVPEAYVEPILVNLGRLDWAKCNGDTRSSKLLDALWAKLRWQSEYEDAHLKAAAAVAYYQPRQALRFVRRMMDEGRRHDHLANALRNAAFTLEWLPDACILLWGMGRDDKRQINQEPSHGVRVLAELAAPRPGKPIACIDRVVEFALSLLPQAASWSGAHSPIEILNSALETEGHTSSATHRAISMTPFIVSKDEVTAIRARIVDALIEQLGDKDLGRAVAAAGALHNALQYPHGLFGARVGAEVQQDWEVEFEQTLRKIEARVRGSSISPVVLVRLAKSVDWHAEFSSGKLKELAQSIVSHQDTDLRSRTLALLIDPWPTAHRRRRPRKTKEEQPYGYRDMEIERDDLIDDLKATYPEPEGLWKFVEGCLREIAACGGRQGSTPQVLISGLVALSLPHARYLVERANDDSLLAEHAGRALAYILEADKPSANKIVESLLQANDPRQLAIVAEAYSAVRTLGTYDAVDETALRAMASSDQAWIQRCCANAMREAVRTNLDLFFDLLLQANIETSTQATEEYLMWLCGDDSLSLEAIGQERIGLLLEKFVKVPDLSGHWFQSLLRKLVVAFPESVVDFVKRRVQHAQLSRGYGYHPVPMRFELNRVSFGLAERADASRWLESLFDWALEHESAGTSIGNWFGHVVASLCGVGDVVVEFLRSWVRRGGLPRLEVAIDVLRSGPRSLVFDHADLVREILELAQAHGTQVLEAARGSLWANAALGSRSGKVGEPFPEDLRLLERCNEMLSRLGRFDPAYKLYEDIRDHAQHNIDRQLEEGRMLDEEDALS